MQPADSFDGGEALKNDMPPSLGGDEPTRLMPEDTRERTAGRPP